MTRPVRLCCYRVLLLCYDLTTLITRHHWQCSHADMHGDGSPYGVTLLRAEVTKTSCGCGYNTSHLSRFGFLHYSQ